VFSASRAILEPVGRSQRDSGEEDVAVDNLGNPWKLATIGMALVVVTALVTTLVVVGLSRRDAQTTAEAPAVGSASPSMPPGAALVASTPPPPSAPVAAPPTATRPPASAVPSRTTVDACNRYAANRPTQKDKTVEVVKDGAIGGAIGAAVGAAGGAIAGGGKGAGTGAAVGGVVGITGGALYGLNENKKHDERYRQAYASCMRSHGHTG